MGNATPWIACRDVPPGRTGRVLIAGNGCTVRPSLTYSDGVPERSEESASVDQEELTAWLTDALYTGVGLGVLAINRLQVARRAAEQKLTPSSNSAAESAAGSTGSSDSPGPANPAAAGLTALSEMLADPDRASAVLHRVRDELQDLDDRLDGVENRLTEFLDGIEPELPPGARELAAALRSVASDHATQVRAVLGLRVR